MSAPSEQKPSETPKVEKEPATDAAAAGGKKKNKNKKKKEAQKTGDGHPAPAPAESSTADQHTQQKSEESGALIKKIADLKLESENQVTALCSSCLHASLI